MNLADAVEAFIAARKAGRRLRPTTERGYRHHLGKLADHLGDDTPIGTIETADIESWIASMAHLTDGSLRTAEAPARGLFSWALDRGMIDSDPMRSIPAPRTGRPQYRALDPEVVARVLHVGDHRERTMVLLVLHLGLRCCEMSRADVSDWDRRRQTFFVKGKGGSDRVLPVSGEADWVLDLWLEGRRAGPLFPSQHAERLSANSISQIGTRLAHRAGVQASFHRFRHCCGHDMLAMGAKPNAVQRFLGHADLSTTAIYLAARDDELRAAATRVYVVGNLVELRPAA